MPPPPDPTDPKYLAPETGPDPADPKYLAPAPTVMGGQYEANIAGDQWINRMTGEVVPSDEMQDRLKKYQNDAQQAKNYAAARASVTEPPVDAGAAMEAVNQQHPGLYTDDQVQAARDAQTKSRVHAEDLSAELAAIRREPVIGPSDSAGLNLLLGLGAGGLQHLRGLAPRGSDAEAILDAKAANAANNLVGSPLGKTGQLIEGAAPYFMGPLGIGAAAASTYGNTAMDARAAGVSDQNASLLGLGAAAGSTFLPGIGHKLVAPFAGAAGRALASKLSGESGHLLGGLAERAGTGAGAMGALTAGNAAIQAAYDPPGAAATVADTPEQLGISALISVLFGGRGGPSMAPPTRFAPASVKPVPGRRLDAAAMAPELRARLAEDSLNARAPFVPGAGARNPAGFPDQLPETPEALNGWPQDRASATAPTETSAQTPVTRNAAGMPDAWLGTDLSETAHQADMAATEALPAPGAEDVTAAMANRERIAKGPVWNGVRTFARPNSPRSPLMPRAKPPNPRQISPRKKRSSRSKHRPPQIEESDGEADPMGTHLWLTEDPSSSDE